MNPGLGLQGCSDQQPHVLSLMLHCLPFRVLRFTYRLGAMQVGALGC